MKKRGIKILIALFLYIVALIVKFEDSLINNIIYINV